MVTDEAAVLYRIGAFGLVAAIAYWFIAYEWLGTVALLTLGLGPLFAGLALSRAERGHAEGTPPSHRVEMVRRLAGFPPPDPPGTGEELEADELMIIPSPSVWPFALSLGASVALTGLVFGTWLLLLGGLLIVWGLWGWVVAVNKENTLGRLHRPPAPTPSEPAPAGPVESVPGSVPGSGPRPAEPVEPVAGASEASDSSEPSAHATQAAQAPTQTDASDHAVGSTDAVGAVRARPGEPAAPGATRDAPARSASPRPPKHSP